MAPIGSVRLGLPPSSGNIEAVDAWLLRHEQDGLPFIPSIAFDGVVAEAVRGYVDLLKRLNVSPPVAVMLSLLGVRGYVMAVGTSGSRGAQDRPR